MFVTIGTRVQEIVAKATTVVVVVAGDALAAGVRRMKHAWTQTVSVTLRRCISHEGCASDVGIFVRGIGNVEEESKNA